MSTWPKRPLFMKSMLGSTGEKREEAGHLGHRPQSPDTRPSMGDGTSRLLKSKEFR